MAFSEGFVCIPGQAKGAGAAGLFKAINHIKFLELGWALRLSGCSRKANRMRLQVLFLRVATGREIL